MNQHGAVLEAMDLSFQEIAWKWKLREQLAANKNMQCEPATMGDEESTYPVPPITRIFAVRLAGEVFHLLLVPTLALTDLSTPSVGLNTIFPLTLFWGLS